MRVREGQGQEQEAELPHNSSPGAVTEQEVGPGYKIFPLARLHFKIPRLSQTSWRPSVQIQESRRDISHANQNSASVVSIELECILEVYHIHIDAHLQKYPDNTQKECHQ